jgi:iron-sulfur cluster repair protein YtfE (RIC family)
VLGLTEALNAKENTMAKEDAISLLKEDHERVEKLLDKLTATTERGVKTRREILAELNGEIQAHTKIEEEIFYPAFRDASGRKADERLYYEAKEEHRAADKVLADLRRADPSTAAFGGKAKVLAELIKHHAGEEEKEMFARAREVLTKEELVDLGERMKARKEAIQSGRAWDRVTEAHP